MTDKEKVKKAYELAETELREKQINEIKEIVKRTLEQIDIVDKEIDRLQEKKKYLKMDLDDLKEGRLDRIEERQEKDPKAKKSSIVIIIKKEKEVIRERVPYWYVPYQVEWNWPSYNNTVYCTTSANSGVINGDSVCSSFSMVPLTGSIARDFCAGTYDIGSKIVHLR